MYTHTCSLFCIAKKIMQRKFIPVNCWYLCLVSFLPDFVGHFAHTKTAGWLFLVRGHQAVDICPFVRNKLERFIRVIFLAINLHWVRVPHASSCNSHGHLTFLLRQVHFLLCEASSPLSGHSSVQRWSWHSEKKCLSVDLCSVLYTERALRVPRLYNTLSQWTEKQQLI